MIGDRQARTRVSQSEVVSRGRSKPEVLGKVVVSGVAVLVLASSPGKILRAQATRSQVSSRSVVTESIQVSQKSAFSDFL